MHKLSLRLRRFEDRIGTRREKPNGHILPSDLRNLGGMRLVTRPKVILRRGDGRSSKLSERAQFPTYQVPGRHRCQRPENFGFGELTGQGVRYSVFKSLAVYFWCDASTRESLGKSHSVIVPVPGTCHKIGVDHVQTMARWTPQWQLPEAWKVGGIV